MQKISSDRGSSEREKVLRSERRFRISAKSIWTRVKLGVAQSIRVLANRLPVGEAVRTGTLILITVVSVARIVIHAQPLVAPSKEVVVRKDED